MLKLGGLALAHRWLLPLKIRAAGKANPRGAARNCILIEAGGAISQMDTWDFKESKGQPKDLDVVKVSSDIYLSKTLFPQLVSEMHRVALVRSMRSPEISHAAGQYHTQAGRALNQAITNEIPAFGSVIAYELESRRKETDTFPTYMSANLAGGTSGQIGSGFLPPRCTGMDLDARAAFDQSGGDSEKIGPLLERRWRLWDRLADASESERSTMGAKALEYREFYGQAHGLLSDPRWSKVFAASKDERERYGDDGFGLGCVMARNVIAANAGTRFVYVYDGGPWDHHSGIFDRSNGQRNHYWTCMRLDKGLTSLIRDLASMPGSQPGKTLLDETLIAVTSEFGRMAKFNEVAGRDHWKFAYTSLLVGGGVKSGRIIGKTNEDGSKCIDTGWKHKEQPDRDNVVATIYSALGIDWSKTVENTPSGRAYEYVQTFPVGASEPISNDAIDELFQ